jgi:MFS superfamily sulfate permease-like transporter
MTAVYQEKIIPYVAIGAAIIGFLSFYATGHKAFGEIDNQVAVLEGFSLSIAIVIALG